MLTRAGVVAVTAGALLPLSGVSVAFSEEYPELNLKMPHALTDTYVQAQAADQWFVDELERRSGGKIKVQIFWNGSLAKPKEVFDAVGQGGMAIGADAQAYYPSALPLTSMTASVLGGMVFPNAGVASQITRELFDRTPEMQEEFKALGIWPLYFNASTPLRIACTSPVDSVDAMKDKKIRQFSAFQSNLFESVGAVGVTVLPAEIYEGLQRGRLDCAYSSYSGLKGPKLYEQGKYVSTANFGAGSTWPVVVNYDLFFNVWPENVRNLMLELAAEAEKRSAAADTADEQKSLEAMRTAGATVVDFPAEEQKKLEEAAPDALKTWAEQQAAQGRGEVAAQIADYVRKRVPELQ